MSLRTRQGLGVLASLMFVVVACGGGATTPAPAGTSPTASKIPTTAPSTAPSIAPASGTSVAPSAGGSGSPSTGASESPSTGASESPSTGASGSPSTEPTSAASESPTAGAASGDFAFEINGEPTYFSLAYTDLPTSWIVGLIYTGMYRANNKLVIVPDMASALPEISADGLTWTVKLKDGIKWHDGSPFTSADVVFSYQLAYSANCTYIPDFCSSIGDNLADTSGTDVKATERKGKNVAVKAVDPLTVEFTLKQKFAPFLVSGLSSAIMPKKAVEESYAKFAANSSAVKAGDVQAVADKVDKATTDKACAPEAPAGGTPPPAPTTCDIGGYVPDMEAILNKAQVVLEDKNKFVGADGTADNAAYGTALQGQVTDLAATLSAGETEKIAAAFRLLDFQRQPVGTGPYKFGKYSTAQSVTLDRNEDYYHPFGAAVGPAHVNIPVIKDAATAAQALQSGDIKWLTEVNSDALAVLQGDQNLQLSEYADFGYYYIAFNLREGHIYSDKATREAFSMCIDHDATVAVATDQQGAPIRANTPPASWAYNANVTPYVYDVAAANAKLDGAGWALADASKAPGADNLRAKGGKKLSSTLYVRQGRPQRVKFGTLARDQLYACGIGIDVKESDFATVLIPLLSYPNNFETYLGGWSTSIDPDDFSIFHSSHITTKDNADDNNFPAWKNDKGDQLLEQGRQELDQEKRKAIYADFQQVIHDDLPYYFLWADKAHRGYSRKVTSTGDPIDFTSPLDYWNNDAWVVAQ